MSVLNTCPVRPIALILAVLLAAPIGVADAQSQIQAPAAPPAATQVAAAPAYPESPGAIRSQSPSANDDTPAQQSSSSSQAQQSTAPTPLGTAAAPYLKPDGVSASRPAGAAIAPAKQRRIRTFSIRTGLIIGAVVAIGVVAGASLASPARAN